jgi:bifunctional non-homologous end joining protein LigD
MVKEQALPAVELGFKEGGSDKIYRACIEKSGSGFVVNTANGRRGSTLVPGTKTQVPVSYAEAEKIYAKVVNEKTRKGYKPTGTALPDGVGVSAVVERDDTGMRSQLLNPIAEDAVPKYLNDEAWCAQEKFDGKRILVRKTDKTLIASNRNGLACAIPDSVKKQLLTHPANFVLDGELIGELYIVYDLLEFDGEIMANTPYKERMTGLYDQFNAWRWNRLPGHFQLADTAYTPAEKKDLLRNLKLEGKEGIVFKRADAKWYAGRPASGGSAIKCKFWSSCSCIVVAVNKQRSVAVELLADVKLGNVTIPPNYEIPKIGQVVEVKYLYVKGLGGSLYQPIYLGVRDDVPMEDCTVQMQRLKYQAEEA